MLLTEAPLNPRTNRDTAAQILFETFNVPALYTSIQAVLSLYASGRTTGVVLDAGDGVSHAVPVFQGFQIANAIQRIDIAGRDVTDYLQTLLRKSGYVFHTSAEKEIVKDIKQQHSYVCLDPIKEEKEWTGSTARANEKSIDYRLPDGQRLKVGARTPKKSRSNGLTKIGCRSVRRGSAPPRFFSTPSSSVRNGKGCTRWW